MTRNVRRVAALLGLLLALGAAQHVFAQRGPSTPEERQRAVQVARKLEENPISKENRADREWLLKWLIEIPDISVKVCANPIRPLLGAKKNYSSELFTQMMFSQAAFLIENPDKKDDDVAVYTAAVEGVLRAYESILKQKPKAKWPILDDLLEKRATGELEAYVRETTAGCE